MAFIMPMLAFVGCGGDDDPDNTNSITVDTDIQWLKDNIQGEWFGYQYWNSVSKTWVTNSYFPDNKFIFDGNGNVTISDFPFSTGVFSYNINKDADSPNIKIGDKNLWVMSIDKNNKEITLFNFAKLRKK